MKERKLKDILSNLKNIVIVVIGDFFLDKYLHIDRSKDEPSVETGLVAYQITDKISLPGAAGTITNNLRSLGVGKVIALGFIGDDGEGYDLQAGLKKTGVLTRYLKKTSKRVTPTHTKPVYKKGSRLIELNRLDIKNFTPTPSDIEDSIAGDLISLSEEADGIIALDQVGEHNCGVITDKVRQELSKLSENRKDLIVYSDSRHNTGLFNNVIIKCNHYEAIKAALPDFDGDPDEEVIIEAGKILLDKTSRSVFITHGKNGQLVFEKGKIYKVPAIKIRGPIDIVGAGDAATSGIVSALCCRSSIYEAALLGNIVSSITVQKIGTTGAATPEEVLDRFREAFN
jgi:rfaE bifunctional protein kinase chain/domain